LEDVVIDGMIVPVLDSATQGPGQFRGNDLYACLNQATRHEELLSPGVASVAIAHLGILAVQVERLSRLAAGEEVERLPLKAVHRLTARTLGCDPPPRLPSGEFQEGWATLLEPPNS